MSHSQFCFLHTHMHTYTQFKKISPCAADKMFFMSLAACCLQLPLIQIGGSHHYWSVWLADCPCHPPHPVVLHIQLVFISSQGNVTHRSKTPKRVLTFFCGDLDTSFCTSVTLAAFAFLFSSTLKTRSSSNSWCLKLKFHNDNIICLHFHTDCSQWFCLIITCSDLHPLLYCWGAMCACVEHYLMCVLQKYCSPMSILMTSSIKVGWKFSLGFGAWIKTRLELNPK